MYSFVSSWVYLSLFLSDEQKTPIHSNLSSQERDELQHLLESRPLLVQQMETLQREVISISQTRDTLRANLDNNLYKRRWCDCVFYCLFSSLHQSLARIRSGIYRREDAETRLAIISAALGASGLTAPIPISLHTYLNPSNLWTQTKPVVDRTIPRL